MKRKQQIPTDLQLFNMFRDFCSSDEDCNKAVSDARKAFSMLNSDKVFKKEGLWNQQ
jgi:hypothetical protein